MLVAFLGLGVWLFASRLPKDVTLRFVVPPTLRGDGVSFARHHTSSLEGSVNDAEGARVATFDVPLPRGLETPLTPALGLQLREGRYVALVEVRSHGGALVRLLGRFEVAGSGEIRVDLDR